MAAPKTHRWPSASRHNRTPPTRPLHLMDLMRHLKEYWWEARLVSRTGGVLAVRPPVVSPYA